MTAYNDDYVAGSDPNRDQAHTPDTTISRRVFLNALGAVAGTAPLMTAMEAWGLGIQSNQVEPPALSGTSNGVRVVILGAGVGGMTAAYELSKLGYDCQIIEARSNAGGRNQTASRGFTLHEHGGEFQRCEFDTGQYVNHGPWRIPFHHQSVLYYAREFNVPLEFFCNENDAAFILRNKASGPLSKQPIRRFAAKADMRGYTAEILSKALQQNELDAPVSSADREALIEYLIQHGALDSKTLAYNGTSGRGYTTDPGAGRQPGQLSEPYELGELLQSQVWNAFSSVASWNQQHFMLQPTGGMHEFARAFEQRVGGMIRYSTEVQEIRNRNNGVAISYKDQRTGETGTLEADYCICTIPLSVLTNIDTNLSTAFTDAMSKVSYTPTCKGGLQFSRRFWETDDFVYGGHTNTDDPLINYISYPSYGFTNRKGVIQGYYNFNREAVEMSTKSLDARTELALRAGEKVHSTYRREFETAFHVAWHRVPYSLGGWASWSKDARENAYSTLLEPDGQVYLAGEHLSHLTGWQAGAIESAWQQIEKLHTRVMSGNGNNNNSN